MAENSKIGWTTHTCNFWWACHRVSEECGRCYIESIIKRAGQEPFQGPIRLKQGWKDPFKWNRRAACNCDVEVRVPTIHGCNPPLHDATCPQYDRPRVFTCSMSDFFHPGADDWRDDAWDVIRQCRNLTWLILTKRTELMPDRLPVDWGEGWDHVWLGTTCGHVNSYHRVGELLRVPATLHFVSAEPLLTALPELLWVGELPQQRSHDGRRVGWVITGAEQAAKGKRRDMDMRWVQDIDSQCRAASIPHFFKQAYVNGELTTKPFIDGLSRVVQAMPCVSQQPCVHSQCGSPNSQSAGLTRGCK